MSGCCTLYQLLLKILYHDLLCITNFIVVTLSKMGLRLFQYFSCVRLVMVWSLIVSLYFLMGQDSSSQASVSHVMTRDSTWMITSSELLRTQYGLTDPEDKGLIKNIRNRWLVAPDQNLKRESMDKSQYGQSGFVDSVLNQKENGIFVECGALDGIAFSNTLFLETTRNWTGLLIEANQAAYRKLLENKRNAHSINSCVSVKNKTGGMKFAPAWALGGLVGTMDDTHMKALGPAEGRAAEQLVQCFPMYSIILAAGLPHVDYLSLDIEGAELQVLKTLPLHKFRIELISVEYRSSDMRSINKKASLARLKKIRSFFGRTGIYKEVGIIPTGKQMEIDALGLDVFFMRI